MKSCISVFIVFAANSFLLEVSSKWHSRKSLAFTKFRGFSWESCGKPDDPTYVKALHVYPNPIPSPGYVMAAASATTSVDLRSPFPGDYDWPSSGIYIPNFSLPNRLTDFRLQIILGNSEKELGCLKVNFSIASSLHNQRTEM
ncbi:hypothetical protein QQF64_007704 [Cirrhinus molitorella]|uniref:Uncharacterized protein n=1 Tax=Cirrhinus molitorella TaxID=172907 RepID=A0ABR3MEN4_9TELE